MAEGGNARLHPSLFSRAYWILSLLRKHLSNVISEDLPSAHKLVIVDYGCGSKPYESLFESKVQKYIGVDFESKQLVGLESTSSKSLPDSSADVVLSTQVL